MCPAREASRPPESTASGARPTADAAWPRKKNRPNRNFPDIKSSSLGRTMGFHGRFCPRPR